MSENTVSPEEQEAREAVGRRLSTETPSGAKGSAAVAHHYDTVAENGTGEPAKPYVADIEVAESTAPPASKQTSADKPAKAAKATKAEAPKTE